MTSNLLTLSPFHCLLTCHLTYLRFHSLISITFLFPFRATDLAWIHSSLNNLIALVYSGCYNKMPKTGWLKQQVFTFQSPGGWEVQDQMLVDFVPSEDPSALRADGQLLSMSTHTEERADSGLSYSSNEETNTIRGTLSS